MNSIELSKITNDINANRLGHTLENTFSTYNLMTVFDFFYYVSGRFLTTTGHLYVPDGENPMETEGERLNI